MYNEQTNAHLIDSLLYCSLFIVLTGFSTNAPSSGNSYLVPANLHNRFHAVGVVFFKKLSHSAFRITKTLKQNDRG
jgi:hypothetical protein